MLTNLDEICAASESGWNDHLLTLLIFITKLCLVTITKLAQGYMRLTEYGVSKSISHSRYLPSLMLFTFCEPTRTDAFRVI